jgi:glucan phosphoethanolaminetransferase (alkaline phosphatase superfamily)
VVCVVGNILFVFQARCASFAGLWKRTVRWLLVLVSSRKIAMFLFANCNEIVRQVAISVVATLDPFDVGSHAELFSLVSH